MHFIKKEKTFPLVFIAALMFIGCNQNSLPLNPIIDEQNSLPKKAMIRNNIGSLYHADYSGGLNLKGDQVKDIACAADGNDKLHVIAIGQNNALYHGTRNPNGSWDGLNLVGSEFYALDCAASPNTQDLHIFTINGSAQLMHGIRYNNDNWSTFNLTGDRASAVTCAYIDGARYYVWQKENGDQFHVAFVQPPSLQIYHKIRYKDGSWQNAQFTGYIGTDVASCGSRSGEYANVTFELFWLTADGSVYWSRRDGNGTWNYYGAIGMTGIKRISCCYYESTSRLSVWGLNTQGQLVYKQFLNQTGSQSWGATTVSTISNNNYLIEFDVDPIGTRQIGLDSRTVGVHKVAVRQSPSLFPPITIF